MDNQSTQFQQAQLAMVLGPDPSHFETLICHLMYSSNELRSQAESLFNLAKQTDPNTLSLKLAHHLHYCPPIEVGTISTILLPKLLTGDDYPRLIPQTQPSFKPVLLTSVQQAQFAMVLGPDPSHFETLISHLMSSSNDLRSQAESLFSLAKQTDPNTVSLKLAHHLHFCPPEERRTRCAILLPKLLTRDDSYIYPRLIPQTQTNLKPVLLASIQCEETKTTTKKLCDKEEDENDAGNMEDDVDNVSKLQKSQRYKDIMQKVEDALQKGSDISYQGMVFADDPEYQLIVDCNPLSIEIENEIMIIHNFIRGKYHVKFPELESLVLHPIDYARVVKKIGNEVDLTRVDLEGILPSAVIMAVSVTASTTSGKPLPEEDLNKIIDACDRALALDSAKKKVLDFVESRMGYIAPNLSAVVGSTVAAKLMGAVGLPTLARMPPCNVQLIGVKKRTSPRTIFQFPGGYIEQTEVFQTTPPYIRSPIWWALAEKSSLAARVDSTRGDPSGNTGRALREEIQKKIEERQLPPLPPKREPLPVKMEERYATTEMRKLGKRMPPAKREPLSVLRKRKERHATTEMRKLDNSMPPVKREPLPVLRKKERYATTEMRKLDNRTQFGVLEESSSGDGLGKGYGSQNCQGCQGTKEKIIKSEFC